MYHCHPCFGGHKPVGPICTTPPVVHPTTQCVTNTFSTTVVPHIHPTHTTHVHHQQVKNQHFFPQTVSNVNVVEPVAPGFGGPGVGGFGGPCGHGHHVSPFGPGPNVGPNVGGMFKK
ncbi:CotD family spore coat protein [Bacillus pseudomycoides]|uniref:CotD family spore coat protein n=1 Tax=Bacillus pseudomycoides TaxID=64104 RepID=UPI000BEDDE14|nr:CotD family spore coat protein [Bacillus pseudomycoides]PEE44032.1 spore coat protein [Bacillus pseudomycoides]PEI86659.1 spore coat protein [Bacillus pseudomycoides]PGA82260.1 spore coat protein [Bacillus pseudomycoides]